MDGNELSKLIKEEIKKEIIKLDFKPGLAMILVGNNLASKLYVEMKEKACKDVCIESKNYFLPENTTTEYITELIEKLNKDKNIHGILVQLPLPQHLNKNKILNSIKEEKDVDGLNEKTIGKILFGEEDKPIPLTKVNPIPITIHKIGGKLVVDPTREEEDGSETRLTVGMSDGIIHSMQKGNSATFTDKEIEEAVEIAEKVWKEVFKKVDKFISKE